MPTSNASYSASAIFQRDWRPSPGFGVALRLLGVLAAVSVLSCDAPSVIAWPVAALAIASGEWTAWRYRAQASRRLHWSAGRRPEVDGVTLEDVRLHWRGPAVFLRGRGGRGRVRHLVWWPDTLPAAARRELRRVASVTENPATTRSMAP